MSTEESGTVSRPGFQWTVKLTALLLESLRMDDETMIVLNGDSPVEDLLIFTGYLTFCQRAFEGTPPNDFPIQEYERKLTEILNQWTDVCPGGKVTAS